ncbi:MAG TPA: hypothetical protein VMU88_00765 [bacterium]|nr:hypothetical protein [bacterium]
MTRGLSLIAAGTFFFGAFFAFAAWERGARAHEGPAPLVVLYDFKFPDPVYHYELNADQIGNLRSGGQSSEDGKILGLTVADYDLGSSYRLDYDHSWLASSYKVWLQEVTVQFGYKSLAVYVTNGYAPESCAFKATLSHENDHVGIHRQLYLKYQGILRQALENNSALPDEAHAVMASSLDEGKAMLESRISAILDPIFQRYRQEVADQQGELDTPENYWTLHNQCPEW